MKIYISKNCPSAKYLDIYKDITPEILRASADKLESSDAQSFKFKVNRYGYGGDTKVCEEKVLETDKEMNARIKKENGKKIAAFKKLEAERKDLIVKAKKLGLVLIKESGVL